MSSTIEIRSAPHVKGPRSVEKIMSHVVWSLLPICAFYVYQYGISAAASIVVVTAACLGTERLFVRTGTQAGTLADWSATITGILLALTLPPGFPLWMGAVAGFIAIALGKALFGGIGFNVFNPALVGRAFVQAAFPTAIATYTPSFLPGRFTEFIPSSLALPLMTPADAALWLKAKQLDALTGATPLAKWKFEGILAGADELLTSLSGHMAVGPSPLLILVCGIYLAARRYMDWRIPTAIIGSAGLTAWVLYALAPTSYPN
ncbi:partial Proton-translocating ferredoxin:NAD(+) oxidoreductase complex subunit D, partial [Rhodocyclaceae bacterium]